MKLIDLFEEDDDTKPYDPNADYEKFTKLIKRDCQPFLKAVGAQALYRGIPRGRSSIEQVSKHFIKGNVRKDRQPKDSSADLHSIVNRTMKDNFGLAGRSEALFTSFTPSAASSYGLTYLVFPIGEVKFLWSPLVADVYDTFEQSFRDNNHHSQIDEWIWDAMEDLKFVEKRGSGREAADLNSHERIEVVEWIFNMHAKDMFTTKLDSKMDRNYHGHEVMVFCDSFYGLKRDALEVFEIMDEDEFVWELGHK